MGTVTLGWGMLWCGRWVSHIDNNAGIASAVILPPTALFLTSLYALVKLDGEPGEVRAYSKGG